MHMRWRLRDAMGRVAMVAIYLASFRFLRNESLNDDILTTWVVMVSFILWFFVLPFDVMLSWARWRER
jgi:hypothetical protein